MTYWLLTTEYPPAYGGGISTYCHYTAIMLAEKGFQVTVFIPDDEVTDYRIHTDSSIRVVRFNKTRSSAGKPLGDIPRLSYEFAAITMELIRKEGKPDYIESQEYLAIPYHILQFKWLKYPEFEGVPVLITLHSPAFLYLYYNREGIYEFPNYWIGEMEMSCIRSADWLFAPSQYIVEEIKKHALIDENKVSVLRNPFPVASPLMPPPVKRNKIVFFGKLSPQKGVFELFSYLKELWDKGFTHPITIIGGTDKVYYPEMKTMGQLIRDKYHVYIQKGLVQFVGKIPPEQRDEYLSDAHVILIPSLNDNLPYSAIEAMSIGKTVLASRQGGQAEIIQNGTNGWLFDHRHPATFGEQLEHILTLEDSALAAIGQAAINEIRDTLNYDTIYRQKKNILDQLKSGIANVSLFPFTRPLPAPVKDPDHPLSAAIKAVPRLLSVVIPYYNLGAYIEECVAAILGSGYSFLEILIVNDGSTDQQSIDILEKFKNNPTVRVIHKKNEGLAATRNEGARLAKGEFLAFLDADDKVHPDYYTKAIRVLDQYVNVHFIGAWVRYFGDRAHIWPTWNPEPPYILVHNSVNSSGLVYKRAAFLSGGINDTMTDYGIEDYESVISMLTHGYRGAVLPECLFYYRIRRGSMYRRLTRHKILYSYQYISGKHAGFYSKFATDIFNLLNANGPSFAYDNPCFPVQTGRWNVYRNKIVSRIKNTVKKNPALKKILLKISARLKSR